MNYREYLMTANILTPGHPKGRYKNTKCQILYQKSFKKAKSKEKTIKLQRWPSWTKTKAKIKIQNEFNLINTSYRIGLDEQTEPKKESNTELDSSWNKRRCDKTYIKLIQEIYKLFLNQAKT